MTVSSQTQIILHYNRSPVSIFGAPFMLCIGRREARKTWKNQQTERTSKTFILASAPEVTAVPLRLPSVTEKKLGNVALDNFSRVRSGLLS